MEKKNIIYGLLSLIGIFALLSVVYLLTNQGEKDFSSVTQVWKTDHVKWSGKKKHVLVEYSDLQCPACQVYHQTLSALESSKSADFSITKKVTMIYRHFPLYQIHENAYATAYAAEAAGKQGKFYEMLDSIFNDQTNLEKTKDIQSYLVEKAKKLGLDIDQFKKDSESKEVKDKVDADLLSGEKAGINATPTFFLDGKKLENTSPGELKQILKDL